MTPRTKENEFAQALAGQISENETKFDFSLESPIVDLLHPKIIASRILTQNNPEQEISETVIPDWDFDCFQNIQEARERYPASKQILGHPWAIGKFINSGESMVIVDFGVLGIVVLGKNRQFTDKNLTSLRIEMSLWLSYALSPELWSSIGKWPRFHQRLVDLFKSKNAILEGDFPGQYQLKSEWKKLEKFGFFGSNLSQGYLLTLPWSFSLSGLEKLETVIRQEF